MKVSELLYLSVFIERLLRARQCGALWTGSWMSLRPSCRKEKDVKGLNSWSVEEVGSRGIFRRKTPLPASQASETRV